MSQPPHTPPPLGPGAPRIARPGVGAGGPTTASQGNWDLRRDVAAAALVVLALLLPWSISFGLGVPASNVWIWLVLLLVTGSALASVGLTHLGAGRISAPDFDPASAARRRLAFSAPYLVVVVTFLAYAVVQPLRLGGSPDVPPGVGPGAWTGAAGALLAAQPTLTGRDDARFTKWLKATRYIGLLSITLSVVFVLFNQYWRIRYLFSQNDGFGPQDVGVIVTVILYGLVAVLAVVIGSRWLLQERRAPRLAAITLGAASVAAGFLVWAMPIGRDIDAFHGIAQSSGTASVGFEGYLAWAAAAAILGPPTLRRVAAGTDRSAWHHASRYLLLLIGFWAGATVVLRASDLIIAAALDLDYSAYDSTALLAFDLVTALLALWLRRQIDRETLAPSVVTAVSGALLVLTVCRIIVGVALAPRYRYEGPPYPWDNPVYGNNLVQQFTSTFDVVLVGLALAVLLVAVIVGQLGELRRPRRRRRKTATKGAAAATDGTHCDPPPTDVFSADPAATQGIPAATQAIPKIFRQGDDATRRMAAAPDATTQMPRIHRPHEEPANDDPDAPRTQRLDSE